jgi:hypothetical protein
MKQRSVQWHRRRLGMVTASRFRDVLTQPRAKAARETGELSETAKTYLHECLAELITGLPAEEFTSKPTDWGNDWEPVAFEQAARLIQDKLGQRLHLPTDEFAFIQHPEEDMIGCSPDGVLGEDSLIEIKCGYNQKTHLETVLMAEMPEKHKPQVQGGLWCSGRKSYLFVSFDPRYEGSAVDPLLVTEVKRDEKYIRTELAPTVISFRDRLLDTYQDLILQHEKRHGVPF